MKRVFCFFVIFIYSNLGCDSKNDQKSNSYDVAQKENEEKFDTKASEKEADFVIDAIEERYAEIKLAELANTQSSNKDVQDLAQALVIDHTKALTELQNLASKKGITVPVEEGEGTKETINELSKQQDPDFDKKWCNELIAKYRKNIRAFESMWDRSEDPVLKDIINDTLINMKANLDKLNALENSIM